MTESNISVQQIKVQRDALIQEYGEWWDNFEIIEGVWTRSPTAHLNPRVKKLLQVAADLAQKPLAHCRVLDLACANGHFSLEFGLHGATVLGIEGRKTNLKKAKFARDLMGLENVAFVQDDVRKISIEKYGVFDIVLCSGILYHLPAEDLGNFIQQMYAMTTHMLIIDTHIALSSDEALEYDGKIYYGTNFREHRQTETEIMRENKERASLDNPVSFWFSRPSLVNILVDTGFTSIHESFSPPFPGSKDRVTFVAIKSQSLPLKTITKYQPLPHRWQEGELAYTPGSNLMRSLKWQLGNILDRMKLLNFLRQ